MKKVLYYCGEGGFGHINRCYSLLQFLRGVEIHIASPEKWPYQLKKNCKFHKLPYPKFHIRLLPGGNELAVFKKGKFKKDEYGKLLLEFMKLVDKLKPDLIIVDLTPEISIVSTLMGYKVFSIQETMSLNNSRYKLVWNNVDRIVAPYSREFFKGIEFFSRKKAFYTGCYSRFDAVKKIQKQKARKRLGFKKDEKIVVVSVGKPSGKGKHTLKVLDTVCSSLQSIEGIKSIVLYPAKDRISKKLGKKYPGIKFKHNVIKNFNEFLSAADLVIQRSGYNAVMEACSLRIPQIIIPFNLWWDEQINKASTLQRLGAARMILERHLTSTRLKNEAVKLLYDGKLRERMVRAEARVVDKKGAKRFALLIRAAVK